MFTVASPVATCTARVCVQIAEYASHADVHVLNRLFMERYLESRRHGTALRQQQMMVPGISRLQTVFTIGVDDET